MLDGGDPHIYAALLGVLKTVCDKSLEDLLELCHVGIHYRGNGRIYVDDELDVLGFILLNVGYEIVKNGREHVVFVVADGFFTVELGIVEDVTDLVCNLAACISYSNKIALDLAVSGFVYAKACESDDGINRCSQFV